MNHFAVDLKLTQHCKSSLLQYKIKVKRKWLSKYKLHKIRRENIICHIFRKY